MSIQRYMRDCLRRCLAVLACLTLFTTLVCAGQSAAPKQAPGRATSDPYTGDLSIFESPGREQRLQIDRVMEILHVGPGKTVADIGAGSGWFTVRAARKVGPTGTVYAIDINPAAIDYIDKKARSESLANVKTVLSKSDDPMLPKGGVDAVLLLKTYHEVGAPVTLLENLRPSLKPGARVGIIDREGNGADHGVSHKVVTEEAERAGYRLLETYDFVKPDKVDYFLVFGVR